MFRKIVALLFGSLLAVPLTAQEMSVVSFRLLETDLTANTRGTSEMDQNGETAALIKIVTLERGFNFDGGSLGIVGTKEKPGELWLYVPRYAQRLTISHPNFGVLRNYSYPVTVEGGRTYEMLIDIGTGRYATISGTVANSDIVIDGEFVGKSPIYNRYLGYGKHSITATNNRFEGTDTVYVTTVKEGAKKENLIFNVEMRDMSDHYGDINVTVDGNADIFFQGQKVGTGQWQSQLREGKYILETHKANCDSVKTAFTVTALKENVVKATPPTPHTGYLNIYTRPRNLTALLDGRTPVDLTEAQSVPVGTHALEFSRKGYVSQTREFNVERYQITADTVTLERINYVKPTCFYFGAAYTIRSMGGPTGIVGYTYKNHDLQASYTFGTGASDDIYWWDSATDPTSSTRLGAVNYKMSSIALKYGYQFRLFTRFGILPQLGFMQNRLQANLVDGTEKYGDGATSFCLTLGAKLLMVPFQHCYIFASPEYAFPLSKDNAFQSIAKTADLNAGGFAVHIGVLANF
ncbi:MAG: PEGA domain-containing protein [Bacteroidaceae bacterium]|nr:PEGA domain-containing protein [Bacteroidaceae bacterium]